MMAKFRKKPVVIEAIQWTGDAKCLAGTSFAPAYHAGAISRTDCALPINTLEGEMLANVGDWIIRGVKGELYPCKPDIFDATYEPVDALQRHPPAGTRQAAPGREVPCGTDAGIHRGRDHRTAFGKSPERQIGA